MKYFIPVDEKNVYVRKGVNAAVLYIQSDCDTFTERDAYVAELGKYISVDSYGMCLNNAELPEKYVYNNMLFMSIVIKVIMSA